MKRTIFLSLRYPAGILLFVLAAVLSGYGGGWPSFVLFLLLLIMEVVLVYLEDANIIDLRLLLSLSWVILNLKALPSKHLGLTRLAQW